VFPYLKKRVKVVSKREIVLTPIETAVELIENRCNALLTEINSLPPSTKTLQNVLQGSVLAQVNAGPIHICEVFLGNADNHPKNFVEKLQEAIHKFVVLCGRAVELNGSLIKDDQIEFQMKLEQGYHEIKRHILAKWGDHPSMQKVTSSMMLLSGSLSMSTSSSPMSRSTLRAPLTLRSSKKDQQPEKTESSVGSTTSKGAESPSEERKSKRLSLTLKKTNTLKNSKELDTSGD